LICKEPASSFLGVVFAPTFRAILEKDKPAEAEGFCGLDETRNQP